MRIIMQFVAILCAGFLTMPVHAHGRERKAEITFAVTVPAPADAKKVRLWVPFPVSDKNQSITSVSVEGTYSRYELLTESVFGNTMLYAEWNNSKKDRKLTVSFAVKRTDITAVPDSSTRISSLSPQEHARLTDLSYLGNVGGTVRELAATITKDKKSELEKARAIYDWVVDTMYRDPEVKGCGLGNVEALLVKRGGKCVDIHSVYVALNRAAGIPSREIYGIRIPAGKAGAMTKAQHCWAELFLPERGWVTADPADVRKAILDQNLSLESAKVWREYFWGSVDENRIAFGTGKNVTLNPPQASRPLLYFGYPHAEADNEMVNEDIFGFNLGYEITFKEL